MLLRRITEHVKTQNWFAVGIDFFIVVIGVYLGVWIGGYQERSALRERQVQVVDALRQDMVHIADLDAQFRRKIQQGFADWQLAFDAGERPSPFYFRIPGSDTPPQHIWNSLQQSQLTELFSTSLLSDLGLYYSELDGVARKYLRYITFVEAEVLPGLKEDRAYFYRSDDTRLKPMFEANMDRLSEWHAENIRLGQWAACLAVRLETPTAPSETCTPDISQSAFSETGSNATIVEGTAE